MALNASARTHNDRSAFRGFVVAAAAASSRCKTRRITHRDYEAGTDGAQLRRASGVEQLSFEDHFRHAPETLTAIGQCNSSETATVAHRGLSAAAPRNTLG